MPVVATRSWPGLIPLGVVSAAAVVKPLRSSSQQNMGGEAKSPSTSGPAAAGTSSAAKHPSLGHQRPGPADYLELLALTVLKFIQGALA